MKNIFFILIFLSISSKIYMFDFSIGFNVLGAGSSFSRGEDYKKKLDSLSNNNTKQMGLSKRYVLSDAINVNVRFGFNKYIALETGLGVNIKSSGYQYTNYGIYDEVMFRYKLHLLSLPILFITKYDIKDKFNIYLAVGPKLNLKLKSDLYRTLINKTINQTSVYEKNPYSYTAFSMDINFSFGSEYQFMTNQYLGLRLSYNLNVMSHFNKWSTSKKKWVAEKYYIDGIALSITYRYLLKK